MADEPQKPVIQRKVRAEKYDPKVKFDGTLEDMIKMSVKPIRNKRIK